MSNSTEQLVPLSELFNVVHGNGFDLNKMVCSSDKNAIAFINRSARQNGIAAYVEQKSSVDPFDPGLITVALGGSVLSSFVQPYPFYTAQNIDVLIPLSAMSLDEKLYYCLCIEANRFRYSTYGREANRTINSLAVPAREQVPYWVHGICDQSILRTVMAFNQFRSS